MDLGKGARGDGGTPPEQSSAAAARRSRGFLGASELRLGRGLAVEVRCGTRNPPMGLSGFGEVRSGEGNCDGGPAHDGATPNDILGSGKAYVPC